MAARFFGRYEHSLDAKGRITLPARFRANFDTQAFVSQHNDRCLALWTPEEFEKQLAKMEALQNRSAADRNLARVWSSGLAEIELDRQGRVALPAYLREFARLEGQVLVNGALDRVELWNPEEYQARVAPAETALADSALLDMPAADPDLTEQ
ncbi:division/cell wall cluster transcriptional repressor MraZ [Acidiferrimicrobium sp. IK]|uniref:division/cell wall cluster transcriptional repressor MraZ n=1 Tax=Acidiferrimicrobium sp. IK TaxID=2871700 RepID=UPI0021CB1D74|nr:division/cell wall cluster transcriptional repressor MraZ [Acidiferrimicrobium sp. IK]MCU4183694.1 division/cell wall cluster transcriptional repressor MraZ [Acidiferrimicrobium sp. IK]